MKNESPILINISTSPCTCIAKEVDKVQQAYKLQLECNKIITKIPTEALSKIQASWEIQTRLHEPNQFPDKFGFLKINTLKLYQELLLYQPQQNWKDIQNIAMMLLFNMKAVTPSFHGSIGVQNYMLAKINEYQNDYENALKFYSSAEKVLKISHGKRNVMYKECENMIRSLSKFY